MRRGIDIPGKTDGVLLGPARADALLIDEATDAASRRILVDLVMVTMSAYESIWLMYDV